MLAGHGRGRRCSVRSIGFLALRYKLKGAYFALATFAFAEMLRLIATNSDFVNRAVGYNVPLLPHSSLALHAVRGRRHPHTSGSRWA